MADQLTLRDDDAAGAAIALRMLPAEFIDNRVSVEADSACVVTHEGAREDPGRPARHVVALEPDPQVNTDLGRFGQRLEADPPFFPFPTKPDAELFSVSHETSRASKDRAFEHGLNCGQDCGESRSLSVPFCNPKSRFVVGGLLYWRVRTRCLSIHAGYACRHSGACCHAAWDIEVEPHIVDALQTGRVIALSSVPAPLAPGLEDRSVMTLARTGEGWCGFRQNERCSLQETAGEEMLPSACRHFPRVFLTDGRGRMVTLSHYCPTAAAMLLETGPVRIVDAAPPLALSEPIEGLDARDALPPLVRPGLLADIEGYAAWEDRALAAFCASASAGAALERIADATERVRQWTPSRGRLAAAVAEGFARSETQSQVARAELSAGFGAVREVTGPHPFLDVPPDFPATWRAMEEGSSGLLKDAIAKYMCACTFGNWTAYRGQGLRTIVAWLQGCYDVLRVQIVRHVQSAGAINREVLIESFRSADFIIVHTVPSIEFGRTAAVFEQVAPRVHQRP